MPLGGECTDVVLKFYDSWNRGAIDFDELVDEASSTINLMSSRNSVVTLFVR
jgi:hypothetical protein